jgi:hypothetical protein
VRRDVRFLVGGDLLVEHVAPAGGGDEAEERRGRVERSRAEFRVGLQGDKVRVFCGSNNRGSATSSSITV